jgi:hypothetical protein
MTTAAPERSVEQRMEALQRANEVRSRRAQLKRDLKSGREDIVALLLEPPDYLETAKLFDLMLALPKWGRVKVNKLFANCRISPSKTVGGLSERQRREVAMRVRRAPVCTNGRNHAATERFARQMSVSV